MMTTTTVLTTVEQTAVDGSVVGLISILALAAVAYVMFRRFSGEAMPDTPSSGRWVAGLRVSVDLLLGVLVITLAAVSIGFLVGTDGLGTGSDKLHVGGDGVRIELPVSASGPSRSNTGEAAARDPKGYGYSNVVANRDRYGSQSTISAVQQVTLEAKEPTTAIWTIAILTIAVGYACLLGFLAALRSLLARAQRGEPFHPATVRSLRLMALALVAWSLSATIGQNVVGSLITRAGGGAEGPGLDIDPVALGAAFVLLALAEVWRYGVSLQRDVEATV